MLEDCGYDGKEYMNYTEDDIKVMLNEHNTNKYEKKYEVGPLDILLTKPIKHDDDKKVSNNNEKIYVKYLLEDKFKVTASSTTLIEEIYGNILTTKDTLIILNIQCVLMKIGIKDKNNYEDYINSLYITKNYFIQIFGLENFLINCSRHQLVPKHRILSKQEVQQLLTQYNCGLKNLPTIKCDNPQAKYLGLKPKQVCEILVNNVTSGVTKKYRICVI